MIEADRAAPAPVEGSLDVGGGGRVYLELLADRRFRRYVLASLSSSLGDWIGVLAILALTESILGHATRAAAFAFSGVMIARILPAMVLGPIAGVYADRWDRKRTLVATDVGRGLIMAAIPFSQDFFQLFVASFVVEVLSMLFAPAKDATLPNLVPRERLVQANQLALAVTYGTLPLGGVLFAVFVGVAALLPDNDFLGSRPEAVAIWANALTFFASALLFAGMRFPIRRPARRDRTVGNGVRAWQELKEGLRFVATRPRVRGLVVGVMAAAFAGGVVFALAKLFVSVVEAGQTGFGLLVAVVGAGMLAGLVGAVPVEARLGKERLFGPGIGLGGLFAVVAALMPTVQLASVAAFFMGAGAGIAFVTGYTMLQESTADRLRGRAFAAFNTGVRLALFASLVLAPLVVGFIGIERPPGYEVGGVRTTIVIGGLVAVAGAVWSAWQLERARGLPAEPEPPVARHGVFVVFEGGEGAGKSTQVDLLREAIEAAGFDVVVTREPGGTAVGETLRALLLDREAEVGPRAEALLYAAARAQHADEVIRPALEKGAVVVSDRFVDSSVAYQGAGRGLGEGEVEELSRWGTDGIEPDLVVLLDVDPQVGLARAGAEPDRLESAGLAFHEVVNEAFRRRAAGAVDRYLVIDATRPVEHVHAEIRETVFRILGADGG